jgi:hypothetical protein
MVLVAVWVAVTVMVPDSVDVLVIVAVTVGVYVLVGVAVSEDARTVPDRKASVSTKIKSNFFKVFSPLLILWRFRRHVPSERLVDYRNNKVVVNRG